MADPTASLPPFPALRAFHAAARHGRFKDAAKALGLSESAISHQVRRLEEFLRVALFERNGPKVQLTAAGARYYEDIDPAIRRIGEATRALTGPAERARVSLTLPPSLATLWVIPNLAGFEQACPDIDLQLVTTTRLCDLRREQIDLAIRYGQGPWPDVAADFLLAETAVPVCRPGLLAEEPTAESGTALSAFRLIVNGYHPDEWFEWSRAHGLAAPSLEGALRLESQEQAQAAAEQGLGLAIGRSPYVEESIKAGRLATPFGPPDPSGTSYHLCQAPGSVPTAAARRVGRWLRAIAKAQ